MVFVATFFLTCLLVILGRPLAVKAGFLDHPFGHKMHDRPVPVIGGPVIFLAIAAVVLVQNGPDSRLSEIVLGVLPLMLLGLVDDLWRLRASSRLIIQIVVVLQLALGSGIVFQDLGFIMGEQEFTLGSWALPFTVFALVGLINAINLVDGMDGLAAGLSFIALSILLVLALFLGVSGLDLTLALGLCGALAGFLLFNSRHPFNARASVFLGDSGSLLIGIVLGVVLHGLTQVSDQEIPPVLGLWLLVIPIFDTCSVTIRRMLTHQNPMAPDRQHLHHLMLQSGLSHRRVVGLLLLASATLGVGASVSWVLGVSEQVLFFAYLLFAALYLRLSLNPKLLSGLLSKLNHR